MDYNALAVTAERLLKNFGSAAVLTRAAAGDYDPAYSEVDQGTPEVFNTVAVRGEYKRSEIDGTQILASDVRLYVSPKLATEPKPGDVVTFDGIDYAVVNSSPVKPATIVVLHDVQCRNA